MVSGLIGLLVLVGFVAGIALLLAFVIDLLFSNRSTIGKSLVAAVIAGAIPMLPAYWTVVALSGPTDPTVALFPLIVGALILALVIGFPFAFFLIRRRSRGRVSKIDPEVFE
ncbi:hypothetical protein [Erythrobacter sp. YT30]|uniref:hypothetical protein n=1 Tax=Erythrobacter sp. YT30 TaxID=1735012 RepID=UPI00076D5144|nr:hypothetical protein [Erythrobacter sp. YT30]KWV93194.1 hypothetical protein AUC45_03475 [Erythrobacter sp. YT30]